MTGLLEGTRVLNIGHVVAMPTAGGILGDWGADVIKVEPLTGELYRGLKRTVGVDKIIKFPGGEVDWVIQVINRNTRNLAVDLKSEAGRNIIYKLTGKSDIFLSNYELSSLKTLKIEYDTISKVNPAIVYAFLTGYGLTGPDKDERGYDYAAAWARGGGQYLIGESQSPPSMQRPGMMDRMAAIHVVASVLAALLHKEKTGLGQQIELSLYQIGVWTVAQDIQAALMGCPLPKESRAQAQNPIWNTYRTRDNQWFQLVMLRSEMHWPNFCRAIGKPELENDPEFHSMETRAENHEELIAIIEKELGSRDMAEWERRFRENDCIYGRVQSPMQIINDPQALENNFFTEIEHPVAGPMKLVNTPANFTQNPASIRAVAPEVGQHTEEILLEIGYGWEDIAGLKEQGVIL